MNVLEKKSGPITRVSESLVNSFMTQVYLWMVAGLAVTALVAFGLSQYLQENPDTVDTIGNLILPSALVELLLVIWLSSRAGKMSTALASTLFIVYAALNGLFFSIVLIAYATDVVAITFLATTLTFAVMAIYGYTTKQDLTKFGNIALMGLFGLIIGSIVNIFAQSEAFYWLITYVGVAVFVILIAYDTQKLKAFAAEAEMKNISVSSYAINGALSLYLDFINLFIMLLRIFGGSRD